MSGRCKACDCELGSWSDPELCERCIAAATYGEEYESPYVEEFERIVNVEQVPAFEQFPEEEEE